MSIETELIAAKTYLDDCYNAVGAAGGTVPQNQCLANLPDAIDSISGSLPAGAPLPRYAVDSNGVAVVTGISYSSDAFADVVDIEDYALANFCGYDPAGKTFFTELHFDSLIRIIGTNACHNSFKCPTIQKVRFPLLTTISGTNACNGMFYSCSSLTEARFDSLTTIDGAFACSGMFNGCIGLTTISFPSLTTIGNINTGNELSGMFSGCTNLTSIHFKSSIQSIVENLSDYSSKFGASNATIYFDL